MTKTKTARPESWNLPAGPARTNPPGRNRLVQSDSPHDPGTTPDTRSLTDLWRDLGSFYEDVRATASDPARHKEYEATRTAYFDRVESIARRYNQATIREHALVEHPGVAWDDQAAVFTTGRFAEGRTR
jgi:hypothetical protein